MLKLVKSLITVTALVAAPAIAQQITNYEMSGNLAPNAPIGCIAIEQVSDQSNPVDLYNAAVACVASDQFVLARELVVLGDLRGRFDMKRVKDRSAHQAVIVAKQSTIGMLETEPADELRNSFGALRDAKARLDFCNRAQAIALPGYFPGYMVMHGLSAFAGATGKEALNDGLDLPKVYSDIVSDYLNCAEAEEELSQSATDN